MGVNTQKQNLPENSWLWFKRCCIAAAASAGTVGPQCCGGCAGPPRMGKTETAGEQHTPEVMKTKNIHCIILTLMFVHYNLGTYF